jgi:hypothetical protein
LRWATRQLCERVYAFLQENATADPVSADAVAGALGLGYSQVIYAVHVLRRRWKLPVPICTIYGYGGGYIISSDDQRVRPYRTGVMHDVRSRVVTFRANLAEYLATQVATGTPEERLAAQLLTLQLDRFIEDVGLLVPNGTP